MGDVVTLQSQKLMFVTDALFKAPCEVIFKSPQWFKI